MARTWKILDKGDVSDRATMILHSLDCGHEALLPVDGMVIAATSGGNLIFDQPDNARMPVTIQCRQCGRVYTTQGDKDVR